MHANHETKHYLRKPWSGSLGECNDSGGWFIITHAINVNKGFHNLIVLGTEQKWEAYTTINTKAYRYQRKIKGPSLVQTEIFHLYNYCNIHSIHWYLRWHFHASTFVGFLLLWLMFDFLCNVISYVITLVAVMLPLLGPRKW